MKIKFDDAWTGSDKEKHFWGCAALALIIGLVFMNPWSGVFFAALVALLKDLVWDGLFDRGTCSVQDIVVSMLGTALGGGAAFAAIEKFGYIIAALQA